MLTFLKSQYETVSLLGLSQGGEAALITAQLEAPDALVVASGYSVFPTEGVQWADARSQIVIPDLADKLEFDYLARNLTAPTLFTYGDEETGIYGIEARDALTCQRTERVDNFACAIHERGHAYAEAEVLNFLKAAAGARN